VAKRRETGGRPEVPGMFVRKSDDEGEVSAWLE
jgi:hypothetical protein